MWHTTILVLAFAVCVSSSKETCEDVTSKLMVLKSTLMERNEAEITAIAQNVTGVDIFAESFIRQFICPWVESSSIHDVGEALKSSGYLRLATEVAYSAAAVAWSIAKQSLSDEYISQVMQSPHRPDHQLTLAAITTVRHLDDMGYMNLNPEGFTRMRVLALMVVPWPGLELSTPSPGRPGSFDAQDREQILLQDIQRMIQAAQTMMGDHWVMVTMGMNLYSGGLIDLNNDTNISNLIRKIAVVDSMDSLYELISSTALMPMLNVYYPQFSGLLMKIERNLERTAGFAESYVEQGFGRPEYAQQARAKATAFTTFHTALRSTGVLDLH